MNKGTNTNGGNVDEHSNFPGKVSPESSNSNLSISREQFDEIMENPKRCAVLFASLECSPDLTLEDHRKLFNQLMKGDIENLLKNIEKIKGLSEDDHKRLLGKIMEQKSTNMTIVSNIHKVKGVTDEHYIMLFEKFVEGQDYSNLKQCLSKAKGIKKEHALRLIDLLVKRGGSEFVLKNFELFPQLTEEDKLKVRQQIGEVGSNIMENRSLTKDKIQNTLKEN